MSFRKTRVHQTGSSNVDRKNPSLSPVKTRKLLHEPKLVNTGKSFNTKFTDPLQETILKYKTWDKQIKKSYSPMPFPSKLSLTVDPPDFANVGKSKVAENHQDYFSGTLKDEFATFVKSNSVNLKARFLIETQRKNIGLNCLEFKNMLENLNFPKYLAGRSELLFNEISKDGFVKFDQIECFFNKRFEVQPIQLMEKNQNGFVVNEKSTAAPNKLELIFNRGNRIRNSLKSKFKNSEALLSKLEPLSQNNRIQVKTLQTFIEESIDSRETKEIESLLSSYDYNKDNQTDISEVVNFIFMDNHSAQDYLHIKKRAIPPLRSVSQSPRESPSNLKKILLQIEQKMFTEGSNRFLPVFKSFDRDNDGFLTFEDLETSLKSNQIIHSSSEAKELFNFLDENSNGFVSFQEFCKKIQPNIITVNRNYLKEEELAHINLAQPSRVFYETQRARLPPITFQSNESSLKAATRYGSSPPFKDTFPAFAPGKESPMFLDDGSRYYPKRFEPINFGHEDKAKVRKSLESKMEVIKKVRENRDSMIQEVDSKVLKTDEMNVLVKQSMKMGYEKRCREGLKD